MGTTSRAVTIAVGLAGVLASSGGASAAVYGGHTSQGNPIAITLAKSGQVKKIALDWSAACSSGQTYPFGAVLTARAKPPSFIGPGDNPLFATVKRGKLKGTALATETFDNNVSAAISEKVTGRLKPKSASGTWSGHVDIVDGAGTTVDRCDTGTLRWKTLRGPTVYGGSTTQGEPVVVQTSKDRSQVSYFGFGWHASCTPPGFVEFGEDFGHFPLTGSGAFGDSFTDDYPHSDGSGKSSYTYSVAGKVGKSRGAGNLSVRLLETNATGATTGTCDTSRVTWSVSR